MLDVCQQETKPKSILPATKNRPEDIWSLSAVTGEGVSLFTWFEVQPADGGEKYWKSVLEGQVIEARAMAEDKTWPESPRVKFFLERRNGEPQSPFLLLTPNLFVKALVPKANNNFWGYLPAAAWESKYFATCINKIINRMSNNPETKIIADAEIKETLSMSSSDTLWGKQCLGRFGRFELPNDVAELKHDGILIAELVLQSCEVIIMHSLIQLFIIHGSFKIL